MKYIFYILVFGVGICFWKSIPQSPIEGRPEYREIYLHREVADNLCYPREAPCVDYSAKVKIFVIENMRFNDG